MRRSRALFMSIIELWAHLFLSAVCFLADGPALTHEFTIAGQTTDTSTISSQQRTQHQQLQSISLPGSDFILKVLVKERVSGQQLNKATVEVYVNYSRTDAALTGEDGVAWLHLPYQPGLPLTIVASMDGYVLTALPWKTTRMPIFSSVTLPLLSLTQGDIWFFEDSVLITDRTSGAVLQSSVQFPKRLLNLSNSDIISSVRGYLTVPKLSTGRDSRLYTMGLLVSRFGYSSVELSPVAAVSVQLYSSEGEIQVAGPIQISLPLPDDSGLQPNNAVPAWLFDQNTGAWMNSGLGAVKKVDGKMMWIFNVSHLGYWIAAPLPSTWGYSGLAIPIDFISYHASFIAAILGGTLVVLIGVLAMLLCCRRTSRSRTKVERICSTNTARSKMDKTTSTHGLCKVSSPNRPEDESGQAFKDTKVDCEQDGCASCRHNSNFNIYVENSELPDIQFYQSPVDTESEYGGASQHYPLNTTGRELMNSLGVSEVRVPLTFKEGVFFQDDLVHLCNQSLAMLHASGLFHFQEQPLWSESAMHNPHPEAASKDSFTQTRSKESLVCQQQQGSGSEKQPESLEEASHGPSSSTWGRYNSLAESVSVPGTLNSMNDGSHSTGLQGNSEQALVELSKLPRGKCPSHQPPRAWFVSLEGKPAAEIHHSITDAQRRRNRPTDSHDTSLDSGVDMSEPNQQTSRRLLLLQRDRTFVKSPLQDEQAELSSREGDKL